LRKIVENALQQSQDNLDAARKIESEAAAKFGGRFNSIVSNSEFAYVSDFNRICDLFPFYRSTGTEKEIVSFELITHIH
jgi:hypothetical protein